MVENSDTHYITLFILLFAVGSILAVVVAAVIITIRHKKESKAVDNSDSGNINGQSPMD